MTTTAKGLSQPARGSEVGTWDVPVNGNMDIIDASLGQTATVSVAAGSVVLAAAQFQCAQIVFSSTLTGNITVTFPSSFFGTYVINNSFTGSSAFTVTLQTTAAAGNKIGCPPGHIIDIFNDGTNIRFRNLPHLVGSYWDYAGSSVPNWVTACTVPPYLNCDATTFSSATYPVLAAILGGTTLPDSKGRFRTTLNQGTSRIPSTSGLDADVIFTGGGGATILSSIHMPRSPATVTDPGHYHLNPLQTNSLTGPGATAPVFAGYVSTTWATNTVVTGITVTVGSTNPSAFSAVPPSYVGGITMIRAA